MTYLLQQNVVYNFIYNLNKIIKKKKIPPLHLLSYVHIVIIISSSLLKIINYI